MCDNMTNVTLILRPNNGHSVFLVANMYFVCISRDDDKDDSASHLDEIESEEEIENGEELWQVNIFHITTEPWQATAKVDPSPKLFK